MESIGKGGVGRDKGGELSGIKKSGGRGERWTGPQWHQRERT